MRRRLLAAALWAILVSLVWRLLVAALTISGVYLPDAQFWQVLVGTMCGALLCEFLACCPSMSQVLRLSLAISATGLGALLAIKIRPWWTWDVWMSGDFVIQAEIALGLCSTDVMLGQTLRGASAGKRLLVGMCVLPFWYVLIWSLAFASTPSMRRCVESPPLADLVAGWHLDPKMVWFLFFLSKVGWWAAGTSVLGLALIRPWQSLAGASELHKEIGTE